MTATDIEQVADSPGASDRRTRRLTLARRAAVAIWAVAIVSLTVTNGLAFNRELILAYICTGLLAASIGRRKVLLIVWDWLPFAAVLIVYDLSRGVAHLIGTPTQWLWQPGLDRALFGAVPTVWLQEHLKMPTPPWWEVVISTVYMSFFILPYVVAGALWLRDREEWQAFVRRFVALSFTALVIYAVLPAAPPWAAARCKPAEVAGGPPEPPCMFRPAPLADGGLLGPVSSHHTGANDFVERISTRGFGTLHLDVARALLDEGQASVNLVAAIPSLHAGLSAMIAAFLWGRVRRAWRPLLAGYVAIMAFALVYSAEHYVIDILLGWLVAVAVVFAVRRYERRRSTAARLAGEVQRQPDGAELDEDVLDATPGHFGAPLRQASGQVEGAGFERETRQGQAAGQFR
ncbi:inositol phosphorylceramide synthase [Mycolicibacterium sphagni]|uniref:Inositol phosphorylceramide synthase n=1 Tax=Mycolicibacterium sphagni TaxID=1786 RepID=A0A255DEW2_9MYCO|nr:phosphatase PAP2 family protein [Mycolicibacterium sphagni]MCV7179281.1 phosphatase PAP2 family protein [Mycolicibacterium sphagni]OYN77997.1 inositol phosphorylceramide synthase [Mycolicibacterium sphagni]